MANVQGETLLQYEASTAPGTVDRILSTEGVSRLLLQGGAGDANTTIQVDGSFDGGVTFPTSIVAAGLPGTVAPAAGTIVNAAHSIVRVRIVQATTTVTVRLAVAGVA